VLTSRFEQALIYTNKLHSAQTRKQSSVPYIAHLLSVAGLVLEAGGDEDEAIAALLHDAVEDQGGMTTLFEIKRLFGQRVADIVEGCTDACTIPKPPWRNRKQKYLNHLRHASTEVIRVSLADKLHNARSILRDLHRSGESTWEKFNGGKEGTLWYYRSLVEIFQDIIDNDMLDELNRVVKDIEQIADIGV
jgi:(p)ppGpp synthase/HD superfamily hydrolase